MMDLPSAGMVPVSATYFETLKIPVIKGRSFEPHSTRPTLNPSPSSTPAS